MSPIVDIAMQILAWIILIFGMATGVVFVFLPVIPGPLLIVIGAIVHKLIIPHWLSWGMIIVLVVLSILERVADFVGTIAGAKWMGATKWGLLGAAIGGIVGLFFGIVGIFVGPIIGAAIAEWILAKRRADHSLKAGFGAGVGIGISTLARLAIAMFMAMLIVFDLLFIGA